MKRIGKFPNTSPHARPCRTSKKAFAGGAITSFFTHPFVTSFIAAILAAGITAYVQFYATNLEMRHADEQRLLEERRRRLAIAIMLTDDLAAIEGHLRANYSNVDALYPATLDNWRVSTAPLLKWSTDDLFLFDTRFLGHYGTLVATLGTLSSNIDELKLRYDDDASAQINAAETARLKKSVSVGIISSSVLVDTLLKIYRDERIPLGGKFARTASPVDPR